jgi:alpha/beta superfamily hydrolase
VVASLPEPKQVVVVPASDHFFTGHLDALQQAIEAWAVSRPWETGPLAGAR